MTRIADSLWSVGNSSLRVPDVNNLSWMQLFLSKEAVFCGNTLFWLYFFRKDYGRLFEPQSGTAEFWQHRIVVSGKVVGDALRIIDVVGCYFFPVNGARFCNHARIAGLLLGGTDAVRQQLLVFQKIQRKGWRISLIAELLTNVFFASFSFGSICHQRKPLLGWAQPKVQVGLMVSAIVCGIFAKKLENRARK